MAKKKEEKIVEEFIKLKIEIGFNDKYTCEEYKVGDVVSFKEDRANELLADSRKLVSKAE